MASKKSKKRQSRRNRRLAKASKWLRAGKKNSSKIGHGGGRSD
jgi:hypothetical protein